jgi:hypothetical protein
MTAQNARNEKLTLALFKNCFVIDDLGNQYEADPFSSTFPEDVAPGATVSGYADMGGPLNANATRLTVRFTTVFGSLALRSIAVEGIPIRAARD